MKQKLKFLLLLLFLCSSILHAQTTLENPQEEPALDKNNTSPDNNMGDSLPELQNRIFNLQTQLSDLNVYLSSLQVKLNDLIEGSDNNTMPINEKQDKVKKLQEELMTTDTKLKDSKVELDNLSNKIDSLEKKVPEIKQDGIKPDTENSIKQEIEDLSHRMDTLESNIKMMIGAQKDTSSPSKVDDMMDTQKNLEKSLQSEIQTGEMDLSKDNQAIKLKLNGNIIFREGEVSLSPTGEEALKKIAPVLKDLKDKIVMVVGHADPKPIGSNLKDFYPTNWELSTTRGVMVVRYLTEQLGINPSLLMAAGRSFYSPNTDGSDRRTEIWILPKLAS